MLGSQTTLLGNVVDTLNQWKTAADAAGVGLEQVNLKLPGNRVACVFKWDEEAIDNGDGTVTGDWRIDT